MPHILFQDKKIYYRLEGTGKTVLLLHGFGEDGNIWNRHFKILSENYRVIVPDLPGSGQSEMLEGECTMNDYAEVVKAIVEDAAINPESKEESKKSRQFCLIGHSMGGYITLAFAEKYPELLNSLGLFHSSAFADDEAKITTRKKGIDFIKKNGPEAFLNTSVPNLFSKQTQKEHPELITQLLNIANPISAEALIQYYNAMMVRPERIDVLKSFSKPVLFIIGKYDTAIPLQTSLQQCYLPMISSVNILQQSGHIGMWEEEDLSTSCLESFFNDFI